MNKARVFLTGGDSHGWALAGDQDHTQQALAQWVELVDRLDDAAVIHSVYWETILALPPDALANRRIICHMSGEPARYLGLPQFRHVAQKVGLWIARSQQAATQLRQFGLPTAVIPYTVDSQVFRKLPLHHPELVAMRSKWPGLNRGYLVGNFHRDTEGRDLVSPKLVKGPDVFLEIVAELHRRTGVVHVVLTGPRRHWLRQQLGERSIPFTYLGEAVEGDDLQLNILDRSALNVVYNLLDVYLVTSRSEAGPQSILEAAAAQCKVVSTEVGLAPDVLEPESRYAGLHQAVDTILDDTISGHLRGTLEPQFTRVINNHSIQHATEAFGAVYARLDDLVPVCGCKLAAKPQARVDTLSRLADRIRRRLPRRRLHVSLWHRFVAPPYGGGNQFMTALRGALQHRQLAVSENGADHRASVHLLNSIHFDVDRFRRFVARRGTPRVVHRIDGPIHLVRGQGREKDELCYAINNRFAYCTVLQSAWTLRRIVEMDYHPKNPVIIHNAADPAIFYRPGRQRLDSRRKIRLISTSWSDNPRKGGATYKWLDDHLDFREFEYTFVGRVSESFRNIQQVPPVDSQRLADLLRQHDIFVTASQSDPCSNSLIEALTCGLPALYLNDGGHPELVGLGGLPFDDQEEIPGQLERLVEHYDALRDLIWVQSLDEVAEKYLSLLTEAASVEYGGE